ncbi:MAG: hypothetical protein ABJA57_03020 [Ginsengibacter sp.]
MFKKFIPAGIKSIVRRSIESILLKLATGNGCDTKNLGSTDSGALTRILQDDDLNNKWELYKNRIGSFHLPKMSGGVNRGDQRAIFYLVSHFKPANILEIGTHIGCSTLNIGMACEHNADAAITTVDINDVNNESKKRWLDFGSKYFTRAIDVNGRIGREDPICAYGFT